MVRHREDLDEDEGAGDEEDSSAGRLPTARAGYGGAAPPQEHAGGGRANGAHRASMECLSRRSWQHAIITAQHNDDDRVRIGRALPGSGEPERPSRVAVLWVADGAGSDVARGAFPGFKA